MKTQKIINAEFRKSLSKPGLYIMTLLLALVIVFTAFVYTAESRESYTITTNATTVSDAYNTFYNNSSYQYTFDTMVDDAYEYALSYYDTDNINSILESLYINVQSAGTVYKDIINTGTTTLLAKKNAYTSYLTAVENYYNTYIYYVGLASSDMYSVLIDSDYYIEFQKQYLYINQEINTENADSFYEFEDNSTSYTTYLKQSIAELYIVPIDETVIEELVTVNYEYTQSLLSVSIDHINTILEDNIDENNENTLIIKELEEEINNYYNYCYLYQEYVHSSILNQLLYNLDQSEIDNYQYINEIDKYIEIEYYTSITYMYTNNIFADDYALPLAFGIISNIGDSPSAYDYMFYAIEIFAFIVILYALYLSSSSIAGEQSSGTLKLLAIKPVKRSKLYWGKYLYSIIVSTILLIFASAIAFIVGGFMYGLESASILLTFNASISIIIHPILYFAIYLLTKIIEICVFASIGMLISALFKHGAIAVVLSMLIYFISTILTVIFPTATFIKYLPFANIYLIPFFGNITLTNTSNTLSYIFASTTPSPANIWLSAIYILGCVIICNTIGLFIFKRRDLD